MSLRVVASFVCGFGFISGTGLAKPPELPTQPSIDLVVPSAPSRDFFLLESSPPPTAPSTPKPTRDQGPTCVGMVIGGIGAAVIDD